MSKEFVSQFTEDIAIADLAPVEGQYDPDSQTWTAGHANAAGTICTVPTHISVDVTQIDQGRDD
ncbi:hypothetical protein GYA49_04555 [Candidatus Beckwithbacteria bacterium]|nr:hypothetical protein [Candidatus Beckwithbacteria bacterium]